MSNLASQLQWHMDNEGADEVGHLFLLLRKCLEELSCLLRFQCHALQRHHKDTNTEMNLRDCTMRGTAGSIGPHVAPMLDCLNLRHKTIRQQQNVLQQEKYQSQWQL